MKEETWTLDLDKSYVDETNTNLYAWRVERETEKAFGLVLRVKELGESTKGFRDFYVEDGPFHEEEDGWVADDSITIWLPKSQIKRIGNKIEMPCWLRDRKSFLWLERLVR